MNNDKGMSAKSSENVTIKDVALLAGVAPATVGRVVGGYGSVSENSRNRVLRAIKELNYHPNNIAQSMKGKRTRTIGIIVANICNPFFSTVVRAVEDTAVKYDYNVIVCNSDEDINKEISYIKTLYEKRIDGMLVSSAYEKGKTIDKALKNLYEGYIPTVFIDRRIDGINVPIVQTDNIGGAYEATNHLIKLGHKKIGVVTGKSNISTMSQRLEGYKKALIENDIFIDPDLIIDKGNVIVNGGIEAAKELIIDTKKRPTAIIAYNNLLTIGSLLAINESGLKIPDDIALIGWDDFELATVLNPTLTVVSQTPYSIGALATEKLISVLSQNYNDFDQETVIELKTKLIVRQSCGYKGVMDNIIQA